MWKSDVEQSVDFYNEWFMNFAPRAFRDARNTAITKVDSALIQTKSFCRITEEILKENPEILSILRMATAPPIARDRLMGLAKVPKNLIEKMEEGIVPPRMPEQDLAFYLKNIIAIVDKLLDVDILTWIPNQSIPTVRIRKRAASIIADRVCGAVADPIIRNEQEKRQFDSIRRYLDDRGYCFIPAKDVDDFRSIPAGHYSFHFNISVSIGSENSVNIPVDIAIMRKNKQLHSLPLLIECKSAGDFTNTNKRRKEEAVKIAQLRNTYGNSIEFILFLCGYFDSGYLGYEAAEGIDWIWEHRINDFSQLGI